ncbi:MAG: molybdopterin-dependent oxidoreductase [Spirosomataceae bacterium]
MSKLSIKLLSNGIWILFFPFQLLWAQTVSVTGEVKTPLTLTAADLRSLERAEVTAKDRDGKEHRYTGVSLVTVLRKAGVTLGGELRGENLSKYVIAKAGDGYEVLFSLAEVDSDFSGRTVLVADSVDGAPLAQGVGPFRLVIPDEKRPARWIRELKSIEIRFAK